MTNKYSHYSYETSSSKQKQQQNHDSSRKVKIKGRRKFNNNIFLTTTGGSSCEQILFLFVVLMGLIVLFNTYHIFKIEDYGHSHSSHNIHQHQYHPLAAAAAISNNNNNKDKEKEKVVVVVPQFPLQKSSKEEEDEDDDELTSQSPTEDNEATKENDSTTKDKDKEEDDDDDELTSQSPTEGDEATKENDSITKDDDSSSTKEKNPDESSSPPQIKDDKDVENEIDEHLLRILRHVGINKASDLLDSKDKDNDVDKDNISYYLPTWEEVIQHVGNDGPIILGLEKCQEYNTNIVPNKNKRHIGIAGPFSSGTHYLSDLLIKNCEFPISDTVTDNNNNKQQKLQHRKDGILWQVPWGKHQSPKYRTKHNTKLNDKIREAEAAVKENKDNKDSTNEKDKLQLQLQQKLQLAKNELKEYNQSILPPSLLEYNTNVLPVVVVRDPWTWMQSMCKTRYAAHWYHIVPNHCPNFLATQLEKDWFNKTKEEVQDYYKNEKQKIWMVDNVINKANYTIDKNIIPLYVKYNSENSTHDSLVHMWKDWYQEYYDVTYPRLMIRLEDLVFYPHETIRQVCECVEGAVYVGDENLQLNLNSAIGGSGVGVDNIHGTDRTGLLGAMAKHIKSNKTKGMTKEDYAFAIAALTESDVMNYFRYKIPSYY